MPIPPLSGSRAPSVIDLTRSILRSSLVGKCADPPGGDLALSAVENQSVLVGFSQAFEQQFQQHAASTEVLALGCTPLDRHVASAHSAQVGMSSRSGWYQDCSAGSLSAPVLYLLSPLRFQTKHS